MQAIWYHLRPMQQFNRTAVKQWRWGNPNILQRKPMTKAETEARRRRAEIEAAVIRMKLRKEGRLK